MDIKKSYSWKFLLIVLAAIFLSTNMVYPASGNNLRLPLNNHEVHDAIINLAYKTILTTGEEVDFIKITTFEEFQKYKQEIYDIAKKMEDRLPVERINKFQQSDMIRRLIYVAIAEGKVVGYLIAEINEDIERKQLYCWVMGVKNEEKYRKKGIGNTLLWLVANEAKERGISNMSADIKDTNERSVNFFKERGFQITAQYLDDYLYLTSDVSSVVERAIDIGISWLLANDDTNVIDNIGLPMLGSLIKSGNYERVKSIIERAFKNRGLTLKLIPQPYIAKGRQITNDPYIDIELCDAEDNKILNCEISVDDNNNILKFDQTYINDANLQGKRLFVLLYKWIQANKYFQDRFSGWKIECSTNGHGAKAWSKSGFNDIEVYNGRKFEGYRIGGNPVFSIGDKVLDTHEIDPEQSYKIKCMFTAKDYVDDIFDFGLREPAMSL